MINLNPANPLNQLDRTANIRDSKEPEKLKKVCEEFESIFLSVILKQARTSQQVGGFEEKSYAREIFEQMQDEELARHMAQARGIGLAQNLYRQLSSSLERQRPINEGSETE